jgi:hypothetical protein
VSKVPSLRKLETTDSPAQGRLSGEATSQPGTRLTSIVESMNESTLSYTDSFELQSPDARNARPQLNAVAPKHPSLGTLIAGLPNEIGDKPRSFYGASALDESEYELCTEEESKALRELAQITDKMMEVQMSDSQNWNSATMSQVQLADISEGSSEEEPMTPQTTVSSMLSPIQTPPSGGSFTQRPVMSPSDAVMLNPSQSLERPTMARRNTCGTMYVGSTLSAPDKDGTIKVSDEDQCSAVMLPVTL